MFTAMNQIFTLQTENRKLRDHQQEQQQQQQHVSDPFPLRPRPYAISLHANLRQVTHEQQQRKHQPMIQALTAELSAAKQMVLLHNTRMMPLNRMNRFSLLFVASTFIAF